jgi:hypothetical protein
MRNLAILVLLGFQCAAQNQPAQDTSEKFFQAHCAICYGPKGDGGKGSYMIIIGGILQHNPFLYLPEGSYVKFASEGPGGRRAPDNGGLTWASDKKVPPERSSA